MSPRSTEELHGRVLRAWTETVGTTLAADANPGDLVLTVDDVSAFNDDGEGGWVKLGDQVVAYTEVDDDTAAITLTDPVAELVEEDEYVAVWNGLYQTVDTIQRVHVVVDGREDNLDHIEAVVADTVTGLPDGDRGGPAEGCVLERDGDEWELVRAKGIPTTVRDGGAGGSTKFWDADAHTVATPGDQTATLTHTPVDGSLHMRWNELPQEPSEFSVAGRTVTVPDPGGLLEVGDRLWFMYAYNPGQDAIDDQPAAPDPPWWEGNPSQGSTLGYPLSITATREFRNVTSSSADLYVRFDIALEFLDPAAVAQLRFGWRHPYPPPPQDTNGGANDDITAVVYGAGAGLNDATIRQMLIRNEADTAPLTVTAAQPTVVGTAKVGRVAADIYASTSAFNAYLLDFLNSCEPIGVEVEFTLDTTTLPLGVTNGAYDQFWIANEQVRTVPINTGDVLSPPYLPLPYS